jgi:hypothetical protein
MMRGRMPHVAALLCVPLSSCALPGPTCAAQRETGWVTSITGVVAAGSGTSHRVPYGTAGSQNDVRMTWTGQSVDGPHLRLYVTPGGCAAFTPPPAPATDACPVFGIAGLINGVIVNSLVVTHGRGNPEILGSPPEFIVWVVGDHERSVEYAIDVTWFFGPDC